MKRIESLQNSLVKHWKKLGTTRKERDKFSEFLVEGFHLTEESLKKKDLVKGLIVREGVDIPDSWNIEGVTLYSVTAAVAKEISETEHSQGIFAHCAQPEFTEEDQQNWTRLLLIDAVQDPGNIGTMIRTASAAGIDAVILGKGCADPFNPKTVRSAQGSHFQIPVVRGELGEWVPQLKYADIPVFGTALQGAIPVHEAETKEKFALIVGNEGSGVSPELLVQTEQNLMVPLYGSAESLNVAVATGILLYSLVPKN
ncbi:TrmH family RNA methyltransferase [Planococcus halotolerans]|uniref:RNA methyltransferase n=1 Tax=Planococcus halotolerans TaxID=2233542 RepID=A0A365KLW4_9BACL|nr:RNA methyltransferase [Planococcus halotolerans]QHJ71665.1 RNA methyltransferase [Planococcus halotolerans]RAZ74119.1 RNA methyltransferase [Planococcus halotolerans]